jgi:ABC-type glycerol-3-phosphate transport system permease component
MLDQMTAKGKPNVFTAKLCAFHPSDAHLSRRPSNQRAVGSTRPVLSALMVPGLTTFLPNFLFIKDLGLLNTYPGLILPGARML